MSDFEFNIALWWSSDFIVGPISKIREVREGEKDYSKRLDPFDVRILLYTLIYSYLPLFAP